MYKGGSHIQSGLLACNHWLQSLFFPPFCGVCRGEPVDMAGNLCRHCRSRLQELPAPRCRACGGAVEGVLHECSECLRRPARPWFHAVSVFRLAGEVRQLVHRFKYGGELWLSRYFAARMTANWQHYGRGAPDFITPVPMAPFKRRKRGYNQAAVLAEQVAASLNLPLHPLLKRSSGMLTSSQTRLGYAERNRNTRKVFCLKPGVNVEGKRILLIDDVLTTGATCGAVAETLQASGAQRICVLTVARG